MSAAATDSILVREQCPLPSSDAGRMGEDLRLFDEAIKAPGSKTVLYII